MFALPEEPIFVTWVPGTLYPTGWGIKTLSIAGYPWALSCNRGLIANKTKGAYSIGQNPVKGQLLGWA